MKYPRPFDADVEKRFVSIQETFNFRKRVSYAENSSTYILHFVILNMYIYDVYKTVLVVSLMLSQRLLIFPVILCMYAPHGFTSLAVFPFTWYVCS